MGRKEIKWVKDKFDKINYKYYNLNMSKVRKLYKSEDNKIISGVIAAIIMPSKERHKAPEKGDTEDK